MVAIADETIREPLMTKRRQKLVCGIAVFTALVAFAAAPPAAAKSLRTFLAGVHVNADHTVTFPLHHGVTTDGRDLSYVIIDASTSDAAVCFGANVSQKLANALGTTAVMCVTVRNGVLVFPASVDFRPGRIVAGTPGTGFPPTVAQACVGRRTGLQPAQSNSPTARCSTPRRS